MGTKRKYNNEKVKKILTEANNKCVLEVCNKYKISPSSFYKWAKWPSFEHFYKGSYFRRKAE